MWSLHISRRLCCPFKWSLHAQHSRTLDPATHLVRTRRTCCRTDTDTAVELACPALVAQSICAAPGSALGPWILQRTWRVHGVRAARWMQTQMRSFARLALLTLVIRATATRAALPDLGSPSALGACAAWSATGRHAAIRGDALLSLLLFKADHAERVHNLDGQVAEQGVRVPRHACHLAPARGLRQHQENRQGLVRLATSPNRRKPDPTRAPDGKLTTIPVFDDQSLLVETPTRADQSGPAHSKKKCTTKTLYAYLRLPAPLANPCTATLPLCSLPTTCFSMYNRYIHKLVRGLDPQ
jgi:hypothetical protein